MKSDLGYTKLDPYKTEIQTYKDHECLLYTCSKIIFISKGRMVIDTVESLM